MNKIIYLLLFLISLSTFSNVVYAQESDDWLTGWNYRKYHTITGSTGSGENYQISIIVYNSTGIDNGKYVYLEDKLLSPNFGDITFTDNDGITKLDYWIEYYNSTCCIFWIEIKDNLDNDCGIYIYYSRENTYTNSNGLTTFLFFDDFNDNSINASKWTTSGTWSESSSILSGTINAQDAWIYNSLSTDNVISEVKVFKSHTSAFAGITYFSDTNNFVRLITTKTTIPLDRLMIGKRVSSTWTNDLATGTYPISLSTWYKLSASKLGNNYELKLYNIDVELDSINYEITDFGDLKQSLHKYYPASFDDFRVRKYNSIEPINDLWFAEETETSTEITEFDILLYCIVIIFGCVIVIPIVIVKQEKKNQ